KKEGVRQSMGGWDRSVGRNLGRVPTCLIRNIIIMSPAEKSVYNKRIIRKTGKYQFEDASIAQEINRPLRISRRSGRRQRVFIDSMVPRRPKDIAHNVYEPVVPPTVNDFCIPLGLVHFCYIQLVSE